MTRAGRRTDGTDEAHRATLEAFAARFVRRPYRDRFVHDALRRPEHLGAKLAHRIDEVFDATCAGVRVAPDDAAPCVSFVVGVGFEATTWREAWAGTRGQGREVLVIGADATWFYAESEGCPPPDVYSGGEAGGGAWR